MMNDEWLEKQHAIIQQSIRDAELEQEKLKIQHRYTKQQADVWGTATEISKLCMVMVWIFCALGMAFDFAHLSMVSNIFSVLAVVGLTVQLGDVGFARWKERQLNKACEEEIEEFERKHAND